MTQQQIYGKVITLLADSVTETATSHALSGDLTVGGSVGVTGLSTLNGGAVVQTGLTTGVDGLFNKFAIKNYGSGSPVTYSGGFALAANTAFERVGNSVKYMPGFAVAASGTNAVATASVTLPAEFRPTTAGRGGQCMIVDNGVVSMGAFKVSTAGILTVGRQVDATGTLVAFNGGAGATGVLDGCYSYSLY